jgi:hypothetical protein
MSYGGSTKGGSNLIAVVLIVAVLIVFDLAAVLWGADSRPSAAAPAHHE